MTEAPVAYLPEQYAETSYRAVGIDPGARSALVCVETAGPRLRWIGSAVVAPSARTTRSRAENKMELYARAGDVLSMWRPAVVVLEEPGDAMGTWAVSNGRARGQQRSTAFALGQHYGLCLAACECARVFGARIYSYPCTNYNRQQGWMPRGMKRELLLTVLRSYAREIGGPNDLSEDELMALGVLRFHLTQSPEAA